MAALDACAGLDRFQSKSKFFFFFFPSSASTRLQPWIFTIQQPAPAIPKLSSMPESVEKNGHVGESGSLPEVWKHCQTSSSSDDETPSQIEEVELTVGTTDDPTLPSFTFRTLVLGVLSNVLITVVNTFFTYRSEPLHISAISIQIVALPLGHLMARVLPRRSMRVPGTKWRFSLNPGPFNVKEHVLITIFANTGHGANGTSVVNVVKAYYKRRMDFVPSMCFVMASQVSWIILPRTCLMAWGRAPHTTWDQALWGCK